MMNRTSRLYWCGRCGVFYGTNQYEVSPCCRASMEVTTLDEILVSLETYVTQLAQLQDNMNTLKVKFTAVSKKMKDVRIIL